MSTTQPTFDDILRLFKETDEKFKKTDKEFEETKKLIREVSLATDRKIKEVSASIGKLGNRLGDFIEDAVRPAAVRLFQGRGIIVHEVQQNVTVQRGEEGLEIDLMVVNDSGARPKVPVRKPHA